MTRSDQSLGRGDGLYGEAIADMNAQPVEKPVNFTRNTLAVVVPLGAGIAIDPAGNVLFSDTINNPGEIMLQGIELQAQLDYQLALITYETVQRVGGERLLAREPELRGIVFDLPHVAAEAEAEAAAQARVALSRAWVQLKSAAACCRRRKRPRWRRSS